MMKFRKRLGSFVLMAGLMASIVGCEKPGSRVRFLSAITINDFPSASAIEYDRGRLYLFGDDAAHLLVLDTLFGFVEKRKFISDTSYRIPKDRKPDIEAVTKRPSGNGQELVAFGSWSAPNRRVCYRFPLPAPKSFISTPFAIPGAGEIREWNIEGAASFQNGFLLSNRANTTTRVNHLIFLPGSSAGPLPSALGVIEVVLPSSQLVAGLSGLFYEPSSDLLLFTASEEDTPNATDDGTIGDSYLGWISRFSTKIKSEVVRPQGWINLSNSNPAFRKQKIESVCASGSEGNEMILYLASDNDDGQSKLFKIGLRL